MSLPEILNEIHLQILCFQGKNNTRFAKCMVFRVKEVCKYFLQFRAESSFMIKKSKSKRMSS